MAYLTKKEVFSWGFVTVNVTVNKSIIILAHCCWDVEFFDVGYLMNAIE